ncbi:hypothetical protein EON62_06115 [archaeon]|nr:MAG: hypothetical protein EON62_06115 [archaeon]
MTHVAAHLAAAASPGLVHALDTVKEEYVKAAASRELVPITLLRGDVNLDNTSRFPTPVTVVVSYELVPVCQSFVTLAPSCDPELKVKAGVEVRRDSGDLEPRLVATL